MIDDNEILLPELLKFFSTQKSHNLIKMCARYGCPPQKLLKTPCVEGGWWDCVPSTGVECWKRWLKAEKERLEKLEKEQKEANDDE